MTNLKDILVQDTGALSAWVEFRNGLEFDVRFVSRAELQRIAQRCTVLRYDPKAKTRVPRLDSERFVRDFCDRAVKGWRGITPDSISTLVPVDLGKLTEEQRRSPIEFSLDNLVSLVSNAYELDDFLQDAVSDVSVFRPNQAEEMGNSESSQSGS